MEEAEKEKKISQIISMMDMLLNDISVPRNIKRAVEEAKNKLKSPGEVAIRAGSAVYLITEISEDINIPPHARTQIWQILSALETLQE